MKRYYCKTEGACDQQILAELLAERLGQYPDAVRRRAKKLTRFHRVRYWTVEYCETSANYIAKRKVVTTDNPCGIDRWTSDSIEFEFHHLPLKDVVRGVTGTAGRATQLRVQSAISISEADTIESEEEV